MTKSLKGLAVAALLASGAMAMEGLSVGVEAGMVNKKYSGFSETKPSLGLQVAYEFMADHRVYGGFAKMTGDLELTDITLGYIWVPKVADRVRGLLGVQTGNVSVDKGGDGSEFKYGIKAGAIYELDEKSEIQAGFKYEKASDLKLATGFVGYNYKF